MEKYYFRVMERYILIIHVYGWLVTRAEIRVVDNEIVQYAYAISICGLLLNIFVYRTKDVCLI